MRTIVALVALASLAFAGGAAAHVNSASGSIQGPYGDAVLGGTVTFSATWDNLKGWQEPSVISPFVTFEVTDGSG